MSYPFPITGPIAPEINPTIEPGYYNPSRFVISAISLGATTTITTSVAHNYSLGQEVRVFVPYYYGTFQINGLSGFVETIPSTTQVTININSVAFNSFISSPSYGPTKPQIIAIGDIRTGGINNNGLLNQATTIPGAFINVSPSGS